MPTVPTKPSPWPWHSVAGMGSALHTQHVAMGSRGAMMRALKQGWGVHAGLGPQQQWSVAGVFTEVHEHMVYRMGSTPTTYGISQCRPVCYIRSVETIYLKGHAFAKGDVHVQLPVFVFFSFWLGSLSVCRLTAGVTCASHITFNFKHRSNKFNKLLGSLLNNLFSC